MVRAEVNLTPYLSASLMQQLQYGAFVGGHGAIKIIASVCNDLVFFKDRDQVRNHFQSVLVFKTILVQVATKQSHSSYIQTVCDNRPEHSTNSDVVAVDEVGAPKLCFNQLSQVPCCKEMHHRRGVFVGVD